MISTGEIYLRIVASGVPGGGQHKGGKANDWGVRGFKLATWPMLYQSVHVQ